MTALLLSQYPFYGIALIVFGLLIRREQRQAREHHQACRDMPCAIYSLDMYRQSRTNLAAGPSPLPARKQTTSCDRSVSPTRPVGAHPLASTGHRDNAA